MKATDYQYLRGRTKKQILHELGEEFNFFPSTVWTYRIGKNWLGQKKILVLVFDNGIVVKIFIKTTYL